VAAGPLPHVSGPGPEAPPGRQGPDHGRYIFRSAPEQGGQGEHEQQDQGDQGWSHTPPRSGDRRRSHRLARSVLHPATWRVKYPRRGGRAGGAGGPGSEPGTTSGPGILPAPWSLPPGRPAACRHQVWEIFTPGANRRDHIGCRIRAGSYSRKNDIAGHERSMTTVAVCARPCLWTLGVLDLQPGDCLPPTSPGSGPGSRRAGWHWLPKAPGAWLGPQSPRTDKDRPAWTVVGLAGTFRARHVSQPR
jgi:hypothetical protein